MLKSISRTFSASGELFLGQRSNPKILTIKHKSYISQNKNTGNFHQRFKFSTTCSSFERSNYSPSFYYNNKSKHLGKGSQCPPLQEGKIRIYSMRFCPYAQRAVLVALAKGIPHDVVNCQLKEKPEWLLERNYNGKVPVLEFPDGQILYESLVVAEYIDDVYKSRPLYPTDPFQKAVDQIWVADFNKIISLFYKILFAAQAEDFEVLETRIDELLEAIARFEKELSRRGTTFFGGDKVGMLDYLIWPWVERIPAMRTFVQQNHFNVQKVKADNPKLEKWRKQMKEDFAVKEFYLPPDVHRQFIQGFLDKNLNYDILEPKLNV